MRDRGRALFCRSLQSGKCVYGLAFLLEQGGEWLATPEIQLLKLELAERAGHATYKARALARGEQGDIEHLPVRCLRYEAEEISRKAEFAARGGRIQLASELADEAERVVRSIDSGWDAQAVRTFAEVCAKTGDVDRAADLADRITDYETRGEEMDFETRGEALITIAEAAAEAGRTDRAIELAHSITRVGAQNDESLDSREDDDFGQNWTESEYRDRALGAIAGVLAKRGAIDEAVGLARSISDAGDQARTLGCIAEVAAKSVSITRAVKLARTIGATVGTSREEDVLERQDDVRWKACALCAIAKVAATTSPTRASKLADEAERLADNLDDRSYNAGSYKAEVLRAVAEAVATIGDVERAVALARGVSDDADRVESLLAVADITRQRGDVDRACDLVHQAEELAQAVDDYFNQAAALGKVAGATAAIGDVERALAIARDILHPIPHADALRMVGEALAQTGRTERVHEVVVALPAEQSARVAAALVESGHLDCARRVLAEIWTEAQWAVPLAVLPALDMSAAQMVVAEIDVEPGLIASV